MMEQLLQSPPSWLNLAIFFGLGTALLLVVLGFVTYGILAERKVMGFMQGRYGPNQVGGRWGLLQTVADVLKLLLKEDTIPKAADRPLFILAPVIAFAPAFMVLAAIPFTEHLQFADIGVGLLYYIAVSGLTTIGVVTGGWASNNKYALLGGIRNSACHVCPRCRFINGQFEFKGYCRGTRKHLVHFLAADWISSVFHRVGSGVEPYAIRLAGSRV
jgi:NADH-quinone oxidoreductase subunit H